MTPRVGLKKARAWAEIIRPGNSVVIGVGALTGYFVSGGHDLLEALLLALSAALIGAAGNVINDYFDVGPDTVSKPWRPIPSGRISLVEARNAWASLTLAGLAMALFVSLKCFLVALVAALLLYAYSWRLKRLGLPGNVVIAFLSLLVIIYGGIVAPNPVYSLMPGVYAFLVILGRELYKGVEDVSGDSRYGIRTIASSLGISVAVLWGTVVLYMLVAISPLPAIIGYCSNTVAYSAFAFLGVDVPVLIASVMMLSNPVRNAWRATRILKLPLLAGLLAFIAGCLP